MNGPVDLANRASLTRWVKAQAVALGFRRVGICRAAAAESLPRFERWLDSGYAGQMEYLTARRQAYGHPASILEGVRSLIMLLYDYSTVPQRPAAAGEGLVSRYAWGASDYHDVVRGKLNTLAGVIRSANPAAALRGVVDTAPLLERDFARRAGLGWIGKNTLLIDRSAGSWFFLAALLTDLVLDPDEPFTADHCGTCRACLDACPTEAFPEPYVLDATRCISYLTIELRGPIPLPLREGIGPWLFGCDVCQEVCPWNRHGVASPDGSFAPLVEMNPVDLASLFFLDDAAFCRRFRHSPLWRSKRRGILRNAAIVLGNQPHGPALPALIRGLSDGEPLVRGASAWALGRYRAEAARDALETRPTLESDGTVLQEIDLALRESVKPS